MIMMKKRGMRKERDSDGVCEGKKVMLNLEKRHCSFKECSANTSIRREGGEEKKGGENVKSKDTSTFLVGILGNLSGFTTLGTSNSSISIIHATLFLCAGLLELLVLVDKISHVALSLCELHFVHTFVGV